MQFNSSPSKKNTSSYNLQKSCPFNPSALKFRNEVLKREVKSKTSPFNQAALVFRQEVENKEKQSNGKPQTIDMLDKDTLPNPNLSQVSYTDEETGFNKVALDFAKELKAKPSPFGQETTKTKDFAIKTGMCVETV